MAKSSALNFSDPFIFTYKTPFMQRIADVVRSGHEQYVMGTIPLEKAGFLAHKFEAQFKTHLSKVESFRARMRGEASARLLFLHQDSSDHLTWVLLFQAGSVPDQSGQKWRDALTDKIILTGYELVRHTRTGSSKPAWTWRYTLKQYDQLRESIVGAIRNKQDERLRQLIHSISRSPGFAGVRDQVKKLKALIKTEWKRRRVKSESMPTTPHHGYARRLPDRGCRLSELRRSTGKGKSSASVAKRATSISRELMPQVGHDTFAA